MKIAFLILAHNQPEFLVKTCLKLLEGGHYVCVHYDRSSPVDDVLFIKKSLKRYSDNILVFSELKCAWGEWSLVEAPLLALEKIQSAGWPVDYVHFMSGLEVPIKPLKMLETFLDEHPYDFIESVDITKNTWVKDGLEIERLLYDFPYNFITDKKKFDDHFNWHRDNSPPRQIPETVKPHMGSQWWTLRWKTCVLILNFAKKNLNVVNLYQTSWIPDEGYFQTVIRSLVNSNEIISTQLLYHHLLQTNGRPMVFMNGHETILQEIPHFFIRKISPESSELIAYINRLTTGEEQFFVKPTPENLREYKVEIDYRFYRKSSISSSTLWSDFNIKGNKYNPTKIILLIHSQCVETSMLNEVIGEIDGALYLGRPFRKSDDLLSRNIFDSVKKKFNVNDKNIGEIEFINTLPFLAPHLKYIIFSYVPQLDWTNRQYHDFKCSLSSFILVEEDMSIFDKSYLYEKLQYEKIQSSKYSAEITFEDLVKHLM